MNIKDIAKIARVSVSTVSRVLNNSEEVSENTRKNILGIMKEYNYIPNNSARNLKIMKSNTIGVLVDSGYNPFFYELINIINVDLVEKGFHMVTQFMDSRKDKLESIQEFIKEKRLDGLICIGINLIKINEEIIKSIKTPIVAISSYVSENIKEHISSININDFKEGYNAVKFLIDKGHREIGIIGSIEKDDFCGNERLEAYRQAQEDAKIRGKKIFVEFGDYTFESGYNAGKRLISKKKRPTAIFAISDIMAVGAIKAFQDVGLRIPEDISIIGFDGIPYTKYYNPAITTMKQPFEYMAKESVSLIYEMVNESGKHKHIKFEAEVLERESVAKLMNID